MRWTTSRNSWIYEAAQKRPVCPQVLWVLIQDHVDILGRSELNVHFALQIRILTLWQELLIRIASGHDDVDEVIISDIEKYAARVPIE